MLFDTLIEAPGLEDTMSDDVDLAEVAGLAGLEGIDGESDHVRAKNPKSQSSKGAPAKSTRQIRKNLVVAKQKIQSKESVGKKMSGPHCHHLMRRRTSVVF